MLGTRLTIPILIVSALASATLTVVAIHTVSQPAQAAPVASSCDYATGATTASGGGKDASGLCWFDWTNYNDTTASTAGGQQFILNVGSGYTASFTVTHTAVPGGWPNTGVLGQPAMSSVNGGTTWGANNCGWAGGYSYQNAPGNSRLYTNCAASSPTEEKIALTNFVLKDPAGVAVNGYTLVARDAEVTGVQAGFAGELISWSSDVPMNILDDTVQAGSGGGCSTPNPPGTGTTSVLCQPALGVAGYVPTFQMLNATTMTATTVNNTREAIAFGIQTAQVTLNKIVADRTNSLDTFNLTVADPQGSTIGTGATGTGNAATTGTVTMPVLSGTGVSNTYTLAETGANLNGYAKNWSCSNASSGSTTALPTGSGISKTITPAVADNITCTLTNTFTPTPSTITKAAVDATNGSKANTSGLTGTANPGDVLNWVVNYSNNQYTPSTVNLTDIIQPNQTYVTGSLKAPTGMAQQYSTNSGTSWTAGTPPAAATGVGATGTVPPSSTANGGTAALFNTQNLTFTTPGGDGFSIEGLGGNIYTVYHHTSPVTVFCQTLQGTNCSGLPTYFAIDGSRRTAQYNGSFFIGTKLYAPVIDASGTVGSYGFDCFDTATNTYCGYTQEWAYGGFTNTPGAIAADGIQAANGGWYMIDVAGNLMCFNGTNCGTVFNMFPGAWYNYSGAQAVNIMTLGKYIFASRLNSNGYMDMGCYNVLTSSMCPGFPQQLLEGPAGTGYLGELYPVLDSSGNPLGACERIQPQSIACRSVGGAAFNNSFPVTIGGYSSPTGSFGQGVVVGKRYYVWSGLAAGGQVACFQFSAAGVASACPGFTGPTDSTINGYTVRALANVPGCLATDGDDGKIMLFNGTTGGACATATQSVSMAPLSYCDGGTHTTTWGNITLPGLAGTEYGSGTYTVYDKNGAPISGFTNVTFTGVLNASLAAIPTTGNTAQISVTVNLAAVSNSAAVNATSLNLTRTGDTYSQVCYQTTISTALCTVNGGTVNNTANAVTTNGTTTDGPGGNTSGTVTFNVTPAGTACPALWTMQKHLVNGSGQPLPSGTTVHPGDTLTYQVTVSDTSGTATGIVVTDDLSSVLNNATFGSASLVVNGGTAQPVALTAPSTLVTSLPGFTLAPGQTAVLTYTVTVNGGAWSKQLMNSVTGAGSAPPQQCASGTPVGSLAPSCVTTQITNALLQVMKYGKSTAGTNPVNGAQFALYTDNSGAIGTQLVSPVFQTTATTGLQQAADLPAGTYWLQESQAPTGYQLLAQPVRFTVSNTGVITLTSSTANPQLTISSDGLTIQVTDTATPALPLAGGTGTAWFLAGGGVLLSLAALLVLLLLRRRRNGTGVRE